MICKKCSCENPEEAVFCQKCGKRLDGKISCPSCGAMNNEEANFCIHCGKKLTNKSFCPECGTEYEGNFCPKCGAGKPAEQPPVKAQKQAKATPPAHIGWRKILEYVAGGLCMAGVFFALLFAFLIGITDPKTETTSMVYVFFKDIYVLLDDAVASKTFDASALFAMYFPCVMGTVIVVGTFVTVVTLATLSIIRYIKYVLGKSEKDYAKLSAATVLAFLTGVVAFYAINAEVLRPANEQTTTLAFSSATIAGIVLSSVFFALFAGCRIAIHAKEIYNQKRYITLILSAVGIALLSVALHFAGVGVVNFFQKTSANSENKAGGGYPIIVAHLLSGLQSFSTNGSSKTTYYGLPDDLVVPEILAFIGLLIQIVLLILLACAIVKFLNNLTTTEEKGNLKYSITATVFAVAHLVLAIVTCVLLIDGMKYNVNTTTVTVSYAYPIVALVFAVLSLGVAIAHKIFLKKQQKSELPQENVEEQQVEYKNDL